MTRRRKKSRPDELVAKLRDVDAMPNASTPKNPERERRDPSPPHKSPERKRRDLSYPHPSSQRKQGNPRRPRLPASRWPDLDDVVDVMRFFVASPHGDHPTAAIRPAFPRAPHTAFAVVFAVIEDVVVCRRRSSGVSRFRWWRSCHRARRARCNRCPSLRCGVGQLPVATAPSAVG
jgi:hypothetical protein